MFMSLKYLLFRIRFLSILSYVIMYNGTANFFRDGWKVSILGFAGQGDVVKSKIYKIRNLHLCIF